MAVLLRLSTLTCTSRAIPKFNYLNRAVKHFTKVLRSADVIHHNIHDTVNMDMKAYAKDDIIVLHGPLPPQQYCYKCLCYNCANTGFPNYVSVACLRYFDAVLTQAIEVKKNVAWVPTEFHFVSVTRV